MAEPVEQGAPASQAPVQTQPAAPVAPQAPAPQPVYSPPPAGAAPWTADIQQTFQDPAVQAQVDAYLRNNIQPRMTQLEQQVAASADAQRMYDAYNADPDAANIAVNRQLYGDDYADQLAASFGRVDQISNPQYAAQLQQQQAPQPAAQPVAAPPAQSTGAPGDPVYDYWAEKYQQEQYDSAKSKFLSDPQYADIDSGLFDPFVSGAGTWEEAVGNYRAYAAHFATGAAPPTNDPNSPPPPPTIGSAAAGTVGMTPSFPQGETLDQAIDAVFGEAKPLAPPVMGQQ